VRYSRKIKAYRDLLKYSVLKSFYQEMSKECGYQALLCAIQDNKAGRSQAVDKMRRLNRLSSGLKMQER